MKPEVTIAVVSWNTRDLLRRCLVSMAEEAATGRAEVWVIDNASSDGSVDMVRDEFPWVRIIANQDNIGFGSAVNEIAQRTHGRWIVPANADVALTAGALDALLAAAEPDVGVVAPRLVLDDGSTQHSVHAFPTLHLSLLVAVGAYRLGGMGDRFCIEGFWNADQPRRIDWAHGAFLLVRREAFDEVGGFDPAQWMYAEDIDLHWRLARAGWSARYQPAAHVRHAVGAAANKAFGESLTERHLLATYDWLARRRSIPVARLSALINVSGAAIRWLVASVPARLAPARFGPHRRRFARYARGHFGGLRARRDSDRGGLRSRNETG